MSELARRPRILIAEPDGFSSAAVELLRGSSDVELRPVSTSELRLAFRDFDAVWIRLAHRIDASLLELAGRCRVLACAVTGLDHIDLMACEARGIRVVSLKGEADFLKEVRATAELTIALSLAVLRRLPAAVDDVARGSWTRDRFRGRELHEKTIGLVGMGRLGSLVAKMLRGFDVRILGCDPRADFPHELAEQVGLDDLLARSDLVSLHVAYGPATHHLIGSAEIAKMKPDAYLVNTSRGGVVDEGALVDALKRSAIAGAALDVVAGEPTPDFRSELFEYARSHQNLVIVPHIGGNTHESVAKTERFIARKVLHALGVGDPA